MGIAPLNGPPMAEYGRRRLRDLLTATLDLLLKEEAAIGLCGTGTGVPLDLLASKLGVDVCG